MKKTAIEAVLEALVANAIGGTEVPSHSLRATAELPAAIDATIKVPDSNPDWEVDIDVSAF